VSAPIAAPVAIVTGGERGIGRAITAELLARGMRVCIAGIDTRAASDTLAEIEASPDRLRFVPTDVRDETAVAAMVATIADAWGRIDGLIANAGIADPGHTPVEQLSLDAWNRVIATNLTGPFLCAKHCVPHLRVSRGAIVLIASTRALQSEPHTHAYAASKGGLVALAHSLAISCGPEIRVNAISPGWIHTGDPATLSATDHAQHPVGRVGTPADIASLAAFLLSYQAAFITGQNLVADGGMTRKMIYS